MKGRVFVLVLVFSILLSSPASANPSPDIKAVAATIVVAVGALCLEASLTAFILMFFHVASVHLVIVLFVANLGIYAGFFLPLLSTTKSLLLCEVAVVVADAALIMVLSRCELFQLRQFKGLAWRHAFTATIIGNAFSYMIGAALL